MLPKQEQEGHGEKDILRIDPLEAVLNLEDGFHREGYRQGVADGARAGWNEGRCFGMRKGFDKLLESGRLAGKAIIWANRMTPKYNAHQALNIGDSATSVSQPAAEPCTLPALVSHARLEKNVKALYALVEPRTLSTQNTDEAVQDFDDRLKRAQGKTKLIERMIEEKETLLMHEKHMHLYTPWMKNNWHYILLAKIDDCSVTYVQKKTKLDGERE